MKEELKRRIGISLQGMYELLMKAGSEKEEINLYLFSYLTVSQYGQLITYLKIMSPLLRGALEVGEKQGLLVSATHSLSLPSLMAQWQVHIVH